ncbi:hypothetical protein B0H15DRAFT_941228 [Mycena belliarum]|uniref:Hydroxyneurosporene synthase n=1 Tax=Mycena belliarum TaxID=1033014 RepID=A0AAD6XNE5_9AGAR|nr:hypothetical protein B0H15DRAFT_941228 [Mycena belliae]
MMRTLCFLTGLLSTVFATTFGAHDKVFHIPSAPQNGSSKAQFTSTATGLGAPKVHPINASSFDWWYFDVVSSDADVFSSVVVTFFTSSQPAFPLLSPSDSIVVARIWVSFANGTLWEATSDGDSATVIADGDASTGTWHGTGFSWAGSPASGYLITIDAPDAGVTGTISFRSVAPGHYPCGPIEAGQTLEVGPHIGWANAVPDATAVVDLLIGGNPFAFVGTGYHDKNWSDQIFTTHVASWYWGHGRVGPYSIVWFDFLDRTGTEFVSAYASKDNKIIAATCAPGSIEVRPTGQNATFPPVLNLGGLGRLEVNVTVLVPLIGLNPAYARSFGSISGSIVPVEGHASKPLIGTALLEQFKLTR